MKITKISEISSIFSANKVKKNDPKNSDVQADRVQISREAKEISRTRDTLTSERLEEIRKRIEEKFYDREEVLQKVAEKILKSKEFQKIISRPRLDKNL